MKRLISYFSMAALVLAMASCTKLLPQRTASVHVHIPGFTINQGEICNTKAAQNAADYADVKAITLAFFSGSEKIFEATQLRNDPSTYTSFGDFTCEIPIGSYTLVAVARNRSDSDVMTLTSPTAAAFTSERPRETFSVTQTVSVCGTTPLNLTITLNRISSMLFIKSTDPRPAEAVKIKTTYTQ